jgi:type II secretory ATPase GspE/PulE/Tfp pilus assembly ATPase PilB-like protein
MPEVRLGKLLLQSKLVTAGQIQEALVKQLSTPEVPLGQILCRMGVLRSEDLQLILDRTNKRQKLGDILLKNKFIDESGLNDATKLSQLDRIPLEKALIKLNLVSEEHLARAIASQYDLPYMDIARFNLDPDLARILNPNFAQKHKIVPVASDGQNITVAMAFPLPRNEMKQIEGFTNFRIIPVIAKERDIVAAMQQLFNTENPSTLTKAAPSLEILEDASRDTAGSKAAGDISLANFDRLVKKLLFLGISKGARDIHIESMEKAVSVRYRIDGTLQTLDMGEDRELIHAGSQQIISRIKSLCDMDIVERNRSQNGSFSIKAIKADEIRRIDLRVSTLPSRYGENVAIHLFDKSAKAKSLEELGFFPDQIQELTHALNKPSGIFLITGPSDSGKTSTLHAILSKINTKDAKTLTVEDPIEFALEGVTQTEVNEIIGNTFAYLLRSFLSQDPDNIMIGDITDPETALIALRAAMAGRTVFGAIPANDSTSVVTRLFDIGIDASIISSTLRCVLSQRLVRQVCRECIAPHAPAPEILQQFGLPSILRPVLMKGKGCPDCNFTGYSGRRPIIELWIPTREELSELNRKPDNVMLRQSMFGSGIRATLLEDGFRRVLAGMTTLEELLRVVPHDQIESDRDRLKPMLEAYAQ